MNTIVRIAIPILSLLLVSGCSNTLEALWEEMTDQDDQANSTRYGRAAPIPQEEPAIGGNPYARGRNHFQNGRYGLAINDFREALRIDPNSTRALNGLAAAYDQLGRFDLSDLYYSRALAIAPKSAETLNNLGFSYILRARWNGHEQFAAKAKKLFEQARALGANSEIVEGNIAVLDSQTSETAQVPETEDASDEVRTVSIQAHDPYEMWIERAGQGRYYLITSPDPEHAGRLKEQGLNPSIASVLNAPSKPSEDREKTHEKTDRYDFSSVMFFTYAEYRRPVMKPENLAFLVAAKDDSGRLADSLKTLAAKP